MLLNMEPDYWGGQAPPVELLGGPVPAPPSPVPTPLLRQIVNNMLIEEKLRCQREDRNKVNPFNVTVIRVGGSHRPHYEDGCRDAS